jgi:hypothetical protein
MDSHRFDRLVRGLLTRRSVAGLAAGAAGLLSGRELQTAEAGKRRRKKRCKKLGDRCTRNGKRSCCGDLGCDKSFASSPDLVCCRREDELCGADSECCHERRRCRTNGCSNPALACCGVTGAVCEVDCDCCEGLNCLGDGECG